jgi:5-methylcytosine-specific restriction endonuclease McrA|tara:strand:- start:988 stop:1272 length:285 start_codon:yes stop_codon:yes gene_type:complete
MKSKRKSKLFEWQQKANEGGVCEKCKRQVGYLTVDHVVPIHFLHRLDNGREIVLEDEENYELLCQPCNKMKGSDIDITNSKTAKLIYKYIKPYL